MSEKKELTIYKYHFRIGENLIVLELKSFQDHTIPSVVLDKISNCFNTINNDDIFYAGVIKDKKLY